MSGILTYNVYSKMLEGLPKEIYCSNINNIKEKNISKYIEIAKFNIQTLHNFLVMGIAVIALAISSYSLYIKADSFVPQNGIPVAKALISSVLGLMGAITIINYNWFKKFNELITIHEETKTE